MNLKDYYQILDIKPSATTQEIKKAYRKLAQQHHPDKNPDNPYAYTHFVEIKEAYEVLSNQAKKEYYLQQRWYNQSIGKKKTQEIITPVTVLKQLLELDKYVFTLDVHRMDKQGLADYLSEILSDSVINRLQDFNELHVNEQIIITCLKTMEPLKFNQAEIISMSLRKVATTDTSQNLITEFLTLKRQKEVINKYQPYFILLLVIMICILIWLVSR